MPTPTDVLNDDIRELKDANKQTVEAIHALHVEIARRFERVETTLSIYTSLAKWAIGLLTALVIATAANALSSYRDLVEIKQTVLRISDKVDGQQAPTQKP